MSRLIDADLLGLTDMEIIMCDGDYKEALKMLIDKIEHAPTIESERKKGKWEITNLGAVGVFDSCSECKRVVKHKAPFYNYCPHCGADMRGKAEE